MAQQRKTSATGAAKASTRKQSSSRKKKPPVDIEMIEGVLKLMEAHQVAEFEVEQEGVRLKLRKAGAETIVHASAPPPPAHPAPSPSPQPPASAEALPEQLPENTLAVKSPMVGTFYLTPAPDAAPFCKVGDKIDDDTVVCIIEAMKVMNEIKAEASGEVVKVLVENGEMVEYGQPLFIVKPA